MIANVENNRGGGQAVPWRLIGWGGAVALLLLPLVAGAPWTASDFVAAGALLGSAGLALELLLRASGNWTYRMGAAVAVGAALFMAWVELAASFVGLIVFAVIALAGVGGALARLRPTGMARAMLATSAAQLLLGAVSIVAALLDPAPEGLIEIAKIAALTGFFCALWLVSAGLFRRAAGA